MSEIRIAIVDDEPEVVDLLTTILSDDERLRVVAKGFTGEDAMRIARERKPDLMTIDIAMPRVDGLRATQEIMRKNPTRIVVVTGLPSGPDADLCYLALGAGAVEFIEKPVGSPTRLRERIQALAAEPLITPELLKRLKWSARPARETADSRSLKVIGVGGGSAAPPALATLVSRLPAAFPAAFAVVQHLPEGFQPSFVDYLKRRTSLNVKLVTRRTRLTPGTVFVAADGRQLLAEGDNLVAADPEGDAPTITRTFESLAETHGKEAAGVVLTGLGDDGAQGIRALKNAGALTIAQERISAAVSSMPRAAIDTGGATTELPVDQIGPYLVEAAL